MLDRPKVKCLGPASPQCVPRPSLVPLHSYPRRAVNTQDHIPGTQCVLLLMVCCFTSCSMLLRLMQGCVASPRARVCCFASCKGVLPRLMQGCVTSPHARVWCLASCKGGGAFMFTDEGRGVWHRLPLAKMMSTFLTPGARCTPGVCIVNDWFAPDSWTGGSKGALC